MNAKVSVIIPAYNAEKTLTRCVESLLNQTLRELTIIIVDDGSKDGTPRIADALASKDKRVVVIHQENGGCYMARQAGLARVTTGYFGFVDADDWVEPDMYASLLSFAEENALDVAECGIWGQDKEMPPEFYLSREETFAHMVYPRMMEGRGSNTVWSKLYRNFDREKLLSETFFSTWEDLINNMQFFIPVKRYGRLHRGLYHYIVTAASSTRNFGPRNIQGLRNTIQAREVLSKHYGVESGDPALAYWIVHNVKNMYLSAVSAPAASWAIRVQNVQTLLAMPELAIAIRTLKNAKQSSSDLAFLRIVMAAPIFVMAILFRILRKFK